MLSGLKCARCGHEAAKHEHLGSKADGEPDLIDEHGAAFRVRFLGGGGVHDAPEVKFEPM